MVTIDENYRNNSKFDENNIQGFPLIEVGLTKKDGKATIYIKTYPYNDSPCYLPSDLTALIILGIYEYALNFNEDKIKFTEEFKDIFNLTSEDLKFKTNL